MLSTKRTKKETTENGNAMLRHLTRHNFPCPFSFQDELQLLSLVIHIQTLPKLQCLWMRGVASTFLFLLHSQMYQKTMRKAAWFIVMEWNAIHKCFFHSNLSLIVLKPLQKTCLKEPFDISMIKNIMQLSNPIRFLYAIWVGPSVTTSFNPPDIWSLLREGCYSATCFR